MSAYTPATPYDGNFKYICALDDEQCALSENHASGGNILMNFIVFRNSNIRPTVTSHTTFALERDRLSM